MTRGEKEVIVSYLKAIRAADPSQDVEAHLKRIEEFVVASFRERCPTQTGMQSVGSKNPFREDEPTVDIKL